MHTKFLISLIAVVSLSTTVLAAKNQYNQPIHFSATQDGVTLSLDTLSDADISALDREGKLNRHAVPLKLTIQNHSPLQLSLTKSDFSVRLFNASVTKSFLFLNKFKFIGFAIGAVIGIAIAIPVLIYVVGPIVFVTVLLSSIGGWGVASASAAATADAVIIGTGASIIAGSGVAGLFVSKHIEKKYAPAPVCPVALFAGKVNIKSHETHESIVMISKQRMHKPFSITMHDNSGQTTEFSVQL